MTKKITKGIFNRFYLGLQSRRDEKDLLESNEVNRLMEEQWEHPEEMKDKAKAPDFDAIFNRIENQAYKNNTIRRFPIYRLVAGFALLIGLTVAFYYFSQRNTTIEQLQFATVPGEIKSFTLPDGSQLWLGENSQVRFPANFENNRIIDMQGLAFYKVLKNSKPFKVNTGSITIEVTGTAFSVSNYANSSEMEATLVEGVINISDSKGLFNKQMKPDEKFIFNKESGQYHIQKVNARELTLWKEAKLVFNNSPLTNIAMELEKRYGVKFKVEENAAMHNFTFNLSDETLDETLALIGSLAPIEAKHVDNSIVFSLRK